MELKKLLILSMFVGQAWIGAGAIDFTIQVPKGAGIELGTKSKHFVDFAPVVHKSFQPIEGGVEYTYDLKNGQVYNYRVWKEGGLTHAGYFTMSNNTTSVPKIIITEDDLKLLDPKSFNHDVNSNNGYETGDIFLNINPQGYLNLKKGDEFMLHAMRTWELTDNSVNNYFIEPDFHYKVLDFQGNPVEDVILIETGESNTSAWSKIKAIKDGSVIVLVTYDGINLNYYSGATKKEYLGGEYWGAIWPENTGVFVVTVGEFFSDVIPNMNINENYNAETTKLSGEKVDAEHDVFYYLDDEPGFNFTFKPENISSVELAYPTINKQGVNYTGFFDKGVTLNNDGSYTLLLKQGRQIVKMTDKNGVPTYQVLTAKSCHREITNLTNPERDYFQPGDEIQIQYSGLFHPANKIAGIYNMSAYVTYNGVPNGSSLILGSGQYTFGSAPSAQCVKTSIPLDWDAGAKPFFVMNEGVIQVNGNGDPIGNHRNTIYQEGRSPNLNATAHKTYFGAIPQIDIPLKPLQYYNIILQQNTEADDIEITIEKGGQIVKLQKGANGCYTGPAGTYTIKATKEGYRRFINSYIIPEDATGDQTFKVNLEKGSEGMWDGVTIADMVEMDEDGAYHIKTGAELAYLSQVIATNGNKFTSTVVLDNDIDLANFDWTPIGNGSKYFSGIFDGNNHKVSGLFVDTPEEDYAALFGYIRGTSTQSAVIKNLSVEGYLNGKTYCAGIAGRMYSYSTIEHCANYATVNGDNYVGGIVGYMQSNAKTILTNCYNLGDITATKQAGGVVGYNGANALISHIYSTGKIIGEENNSIGACVGGTSSKGNVSDAYSTNKYELDDNSVSVSEDAMASGEIAFALGNEIFFQNIGEDLSPVFNGATVYYDEETDTYYNIASSITIDLGEGNEDVEVVEDGLEIVKGETYSLGIIADPIQGRYPGVEWSSSNPEIVSIDENGKIEALELGEVEISVKTVINDENFVDSCKITVIESKPEEEDPSDSELPSQDPNIPDTPEEPEEPTENPQNPGTTSIISLFGDTSSVDVFDMNGRIIARNVKVSSLHTLSEGLYIIKSSEQEKKVLIK